MPPDPSAPAATSCGRVGSLLRLIIGLAALLGIASLFFDVKGTITRWFAGGCADAATLEVDAALFEPWLKVTGKAAGSCGAVRLTLERTKAFPATDPLLEAALGTGDQGSLASRLRNRMALASLARGRMHADFFAADGTVSGSAFVSVAGLRQSATLTVEVPLPASPRTVRIELGP